MTALDATVRLFITFGVGGAARKSTVIRLAIPSEEAFRLIGGRKLPSVPGKLRLILITTVLMVAGCSRSSDAEARKKLQGTWVANGSGLHGDDFNSTISIDSGGGYVCKVITHSPFYSRTITSDLAGTLRITNGFLIDTTTQHSNTNAVLPYVTKFRIVRLDNRELVLSPYLSNDWEFPTNDVVFRRESK